ncbi:MAG: alkaline phosphatase family protein [Pseudomonadota bacterium]
MSRLLFLEFNEVNFKMLERYIEFGALPNFERLFTQHGYTETESESIYENIEPWIQWVTAHTGKTLAEHKVFRLGDIVDHDLEQIWEQVERQGFRVAAMSPMNAANCTNEAAFFVPDPWTKTAVTGGMLLKQAHAAIRQAVGDNAAGRLTWHSAFWLGLFATINVRPSQYVQMIKLIVQSRNRKWIKPIALDMLLANAFVSQVKRRQPDFATLFVNAAAHVQHHYLFSSKAYEGERSNPAWYVSANVDPLLDVYAAYDRILGLVQNTFPDARLMIATGLHQDPHENITFYWRLKNHDSFLTRLGVPFVRIDPLMSRDFIVVCQNVSDALSTETILSACVDKHGTPLFEVDNRGDNLFVMLTYPNDIDHDFEFISEDDVHSGFRDDIAFVAIKNGQHNGVGYFVDTGVQSPVHQAERQPLSFIPRRVMQAMTE